MMSRLVVFLICCVAIAYTSSLDCLQAPGTPTKDCLSKLNLAQVGDDPHVLLTVGQACLATDLNQKAVDAFKKAIQLSTQPDPRQLLIVLGLFRQNKYYQALKAQYNGLIRLGLAYPSLLSDLLSKYPISNFETFINKKSKTTPYKDLAVANYFAGDYSQTLRLLTNDVRLIDNVHQLHYLHLRATEKIGDFQRALHAIKSLTRRHQDNFYLFHLEGNFLMHHLRYREAAECFEKAIKLKPLFQMSHYNKALCEQSLGRYEESLRTLRQLERIVEKYEWVPKGQMYNMMGFAEAQVGDKGKAREYYGKAVKDGFDEGRAEAYYNLGALQYEEEDYQAALDSFDNSLKISADLTKPKMLKALVLSDLNRHNQAIQILTPMKSNSQALAHLSSVLLKANKPQQSQKAAQKAISLNQSNAQAHFNLGLTLLHLKNYQRAKDSLLKAHKLDQDLFVENYVKSCEERLRDETL